MTLLLTLSVLILSGIAGDLSNLAERMVRR